MDPERLAEIDAVFAAALELRPAERPAFLAERCAGDAALRSEVEELLEQSGERAEALAAPLRAAVVRLAAGTPGELAPGAAVGDWRIVRRLGRGGMGVVYLGERRGADFVQRGAIKILPAATSSEAAVRRFELERRILARVAHPHIAHLIDGGIDARGLPFLVMEHVAGRPLDEHCDEERLPVEARLRLMITIAQAVDAAHRNLVVHRDLKPSNILITPDGVVKLLDFGIAKLLAPEPGEAGLTATEGRPMTPTYASPEQVRGEPIATAADVYQLGLLLYELLTGRRPQAATSGSLAELVRLVCEREPPPPSRAVLLAGPERPPEQLAELRRSTPARLAKRYRGDVDALVGRALEKDPERRYGSAAALAADLERLLDGRPLRARRPTTLYRAGKFLRRHVAATLAAALAVVLTLAYAVAVTFQARAIERQRQRAEVETAKAREVERFLLSLFESSDPWMGLGREISARELLERGAERLERDLAGQPEVRARLASALGEIHGALDLVEAGRALVERALEQQLRLTGEHDLEVAASYHRLGVLHRLADDIPEAVAALARALELRRRLLPPDAPELARTLARLGEAQRRAGDLEGAEASYREALELEQRRGDPAGVSAALSSLGSLRYSHRDYAGAESFFRRGLELERSAGDPRGAGVATHLLNLGMALRRQDRIEPARAALEAALELHREVFGPDHLTTSWARVELGMAHQQAGDLERAEAELAGVHPLLVERLGNADARTADVGVGFGQLRVRQGSFVQGERLLREAVATLTERYGPDHYRLGSGLLWLGRALAGQGRFAEAIETWRAGHAKMRPGIDDKLRGEFRAELVAAGRPEPEAAVAP